MIEEKVIRDMPMQLLMVCKPDERQWELACQYVCQNASGYAGVLYKNRLTGIYMLYCAGTWRSIDQKFAKSVNVRNGVLI